jgi:hypothetical protein
MTACLHRRVPQRHVIVFKFYWVIERVARHWHLERSRRHGAAAAKGHKKAVGASDIHKQQLAPHPSPEAKVRRYHISKLHMTELVVKPNGFSVVN